MTYWTCHKCKYDKWVGYEFDDEEEPTCRICDGYLEEFEGYPEEFEEAAEEEEKVLN